MTSPTSTATRRPTADDLDTYQRDGFLVVRDLIPSDVLDAAERGMERFYAGDVDRPFPGGVDQYAWTPADGDVLRKNDWSALMVDELAALVRHPSLSAFAAVLADTDEIRLWHDQLLYKPPGPRVGPVRVGWHTDRQYWTTCSSEQMLTGWVPFHAVDEVMGVVSFIPGSHRWAQPVGIGFSDQDWAEQERALAASGDVRIVAPELGRGDVTFHHCRTVHGSGPNRSDRPRRSLAVHLQPGDNHWIAATAPDGTPEAHGNDRLVARDADDHPDYSDPHICPVLYPST